MILLDYKEALCWNSLVLLYFLAFIRWNNWSKISMRKVQREGKRKRTLSSQMQGEVCHSGSRFVCQDTQERRWIRRRRGSALVQKKGNKKRTLRIEMEGTEGRNKNRGECETNLCDCNDQSSKNFRQAGNPEGMCIQLNKCQSERKMVKDPQTNPLTRVAVS